MLLVLVFIKKIIAKKSYTNYFKKKAGLIYFKKYNIFILFNYIREYTNFGIKYLNNLENDLFFIIFN
jgi:hypothetical protein